MPDLGTFFSTLLSYYVLVFIGTYLGMVLISRFRIMNPISVAYGVAMMGYVAVFLVLGLPIVLALISRVDPLGWLWQWIGDWIAWALRENPDVI